MILSLDFLRTLTSLHSPGPQSSISAATAPKPVVNLLTTCGFPAEEAVFKGCQSAAFSRGNWDLTTNCSLWHRVCVFPPPLLPLCTIKPITQHFTFHCLTNLWGSQPQRMSAINPALTGLHPYLVFLNVEHCENMMRLCCVSCILPAQEKGPMAGFGRRHRTPLSLFFGLAATQFWLDQESSAVSAPFLGPPLYVLFPNFLWPPEKRGTQFGGTPGSLVDSHTGWNSHTRTSACWRGESPAVSRTVRVNLCWKRSRKLSYD